MAKIPTYEEAKVLLQNHNKEAFHLKHGEIVSGVMRYFAKKYDPEQEEFWAVVGLLHDLDFEEYPEEHCVKQVELMKQYDLDDRIIHSTCSHGWGETGTTEEPTHFMEKILFACDELTGLIGAVAIMRPSKSVDDLELKSVKKKYKNLGFAAGCSRETINKGAELLGWELDELISETILAMRSMNPEAGI